jgi:diguanylate cyclase (GGDEF)-like protein
VKVDSAAYLRLINIGRALSAEKDIDSLLDRISAEAKTMANADAGSLYLTVDDEVLSFVIVFNDRLNIAQGGNSGNPITLPDVPLRRASGEPNMSNIATRSANSGEVIIIDDLYQSKEFDSSGAKKFDELTGYESRSFLTLPLKDSKDKTLGILQLLNAKDEQDEVIAFPKDVVPLMEALASQASLALENCHLLDEQVVLRKQLEIEVDERTEELKNALEKLSEAHIILKELTTIDPVTSIRNRQYFEQMFELEWSRASRQQYPITLLLIDIDHFKKVNDTYGHLAGDICLAEVARSIDAFFKRPTDIVARFGGEEFVVALPYVKEATSHALAEQVREAIESLTVVADGHPIGVTISIGYGTVLPQPNSLPRSLLSQVDKALYKGKGLGRNKAVSTQALSE